MKSKVERIPNLFANKIKSEANKISTKIAIKVKSIKIRLPQIPYHWNDAIKADQPTEPSSGPPIPFSFYAFISITLISTAHFPSPYSSRHLWHSSHCSYFKCQNLDYTRLEMPPIPIPIPIPHSPLTNDSEKRKQMWKEEFSKKS